MFVSESTDSSKNTEGTCEGGVCAKVLLCSSRGTAWEVKEEAPSLGRSLLHNLEKDPWSWQEERRYTAGSEEERTHIGALRLGGKGLRNSDV